MWIKICGVQRQDHARILAGFRINALGLNRYQPSSRYISSERARDIAQIVREVSSDVRLVGIYVNETSAFILDDHERIGYDMVQLHGDESPSQAEQLGKHLDVIKAFRVDDDFSPDVFKDYSCSAFLIDAYHPGRYGGTGETAPWDRIRSWTQEQRIILAGGLNPDNVGEAIRTVSPWGMDVCSGVENKRGEKDIEQVKRLLRNVSEAL